MGKIYKRKTTRQSWPKESMKAAVQEVKEGAAVNAMAKKYNIPEATLRRYAKKYSEETMPVSAGRFRCTFSNEQLENLRQYVEDLNTRAFGVTREQFAKIIFDYAETLKINHRFNKETKKAGKDFIQAFMTKFNFSLRKPEATSAARLAAFNRINVKSFFDLYEDILTKTKYAAHQIFNVDETGCPTVPTKTPKVLSPTGTRRVIKISSAEKGTNVSVACCCSAVGQYVPPFFIFPRVRMQQHFLNGAPMGSSAVCNESGWMNAEAFVEWLKHFVKNVRPCKENPILLLMDNHSSHVTLQAVNLCRENHISVLGFPPHTSHRMQPLDVGLYGPFKTAYSRACNDYLMQNPGQVITIKDVAALFNVAYDKVATIKNAVQSFKATGLVPLNSQIFNDSDFEPSMTTDKPYEPSKNVDENLDHDVPGLPDVTNVLSANMVTAVGGTSQNTSSNVLDISLPGPSNAESLNCLPPLPIAAYKEKKLRKKLPTLHITSTPVKSALEEKENERKTKEEKKEINRRRREENKRKKVEIKKKQIKKGNHVRKVRFDDHDDGESSDSSISVNYMEEDDDNVEEQEEICLICNDSGKNEIWYACSLCGKWVHAACSGLTSAEAKRKAYICDFCDNN